MKLLCRTGWICLAAFILLLELGCGEQYRPVANPVIGPGGQPQPTHYAYVVNNNPAGNGSLMQVNVSGDSVTAVQSTGLGSNYAAFPNNSAAAVFITNGGADSVSVYNITAPGVVTTINLLPGSHPVAIATAQNGFMYVLNSGPNSACPNGGSVSTISTASLAVSNTACLAIEVSPGVFNYGLNPIALVQAAGGGRIYAISQGDNSVWALDPASQSVVADFTMANGIGLNPVFLVSSRDGAYIFVVTEGDGLSQGALNIISTSNYSVVPSVPLGIRPTFAFFDPTLVRLYVTNSGSNTVSIFDASNVNINGSPAVPLLGTTPVGSNPISVTALPNGTRFFVANSGSNDVTDASATSFAVLNTIPLPSGSNPVWIASEPTSTKVYVANQSTTSVIQTVNDAVAVNIPAPAQNLNCTSSCALQQPVMIITN